MRIKRTFYAPPALIQHVCINHRSRNIRVAQQFLHRANIVTIAQHMGRETMAQRMRRRGLVDTGMQRRLLDCALQSLLVQMMTSDDARARVRRKLVRRKHVLPGPLTRRIWVLAFQREGR